VNLLKTLKHGFEIFFQKYHEMYKNVKVKNIVHLHLYTNFQ